MSDPIRVLVLGTGRMGAGIARLILGKTKLALVGVFGRRAERAGMDIGHAIGLGRDLDLRLGDDLDALIRATQPEVAIQATCSRLAEAREEILPLLRAGVRVISIAEEMACPARDSAMAAELHRTAIAQGAAAVGAGVNPGFAMDLLPIALSGACADVESITVTRTNDLAPYGPTVLASQGVGLDPEAFRRGVADGSVAGHIGFPESIRMIAGAVGWEVERIEESRKPILSRVRRETEFVTVEPGQAAGCLHRAAAHVAGRPAITLIHPQQVRPELEGVATGDLIEIAGDPPLRLESRPEIPGGRATAALAVNMIPHILAAPPGLHAMADLPVPAAMLGDARRLIGPAAQWEQTDG